MAKPKRAKNAKKTKKRPAYLPGDLTHQALIDRIIRVDHAGEYGAKRIYQGQLAVLRGTPSENLIREMQEHELEHLEYFEKEIPKRNARPTALLPLWHMLGFALGAGTALLGEKAAMACTIAVEEVIEQHYQKQLSALGGKEKDLAKHIEKFCAEEVHHRDIGVAQGGREAPGFQILEKAIKTASKAAIWLSERV